MDLIRPFSQGTQFLDWLLGNCDQCRKGSYNGPTHDVPCVLEAALLDAAIGDGSIARDIADRLGVPKQTWSEWGCQEFEPAAEAAAEDAPGNA